MSIERNKTLPQMKSVTSSTPIRLRHSGTTSRDNTETNKRSGKFHPQNPPLDSPSLHEKLRSRARLAANSLLDSMRLPLQHRLVGHSLLSQVALEKNFRRIIMILGGFMGSIATADKWSHVVSSFYHLILELEMLLDLVGETTLDEVKMTLYKWFGVSELEPQADQGRSFLDMLHELRESKERLVNMQVFTQFTTLVKMICTSTMAKMLGISSRFRSWFPVNNKEMIPKNASYFTILEMVCSALLDFSEGAYQYFVEGVDAEFVHTPREYRAWAKEVRFLIDKQHFRTFDEEPKEGWVKYDDYADRIEAAIRQGNEIIERASDNGLTAEAKSLTAFYSSLHSVYQKVILSQAYGENRCTPFGLLIVGTPQTGKSYLMKLAFKMYSDMAESKEKFSDKSIYTINPTAKYFDGYCGQQYVVLDDIGSMKSPPGMPSPDHGNIISIINSVPFVPDQAAIEDKGRIAMRAKMVVATSNLPMGGIPKSLTTPAAGMRRFPFRLRVQVKEQFQIIGTGGVATGALDPSRVKAMKADPKSVYDLSLERLVLVPAAPGAPGIHCHYEPIVEGDVDLVYSRLGGVMKDFLDGQRHSKKLLSSMEDIKFCTICCLSDCSCNTSPTCDDCQGNICACGDLQAQSYYPTDVIQFVSYMFMFYHLYSLFVSYVRKVPIIIRREIKSIVDDITSPERLEQILDDVGTAAERKILGAKAYIKDQLATLGKVIVAAMGAGLVYRYFSASLEPQMPTPTFKERMSSPWLYKVPKELKLSAASLSAVVADQLPVFSRSLVYFYFVDRPTYKFFGVPVGGRDYVFTSHSMPTSPMRVVFGKVLRTAHMSTEKELILEPCMISTNVERDLALVRIPQLPPCPNLEKYLLEDMPETGLTMRGELLVSNPTTLEVEPKLLISQTTSLPGYKYAGTTYGSQGCFQSYSFSQNGACGSPYVAQWNGHPVFVGIHTVGSLTKAAGYCAVITKPILAELRDGLDSLIPQGMPRHEPDLTHYTGEVHISQHIHYKSIVRFTKGTAEVLGEITGDIPKGNPRHDVEKALFHDDVQQYYGDVKYRTPIMRSGNSPHGYINPLQSALDQIANSRLCLSVSSLEKAAQAFLDDALSFVPSGEISLLTPVSDEVAINGEPGKKHVGSIKYKAGGGFGMFTSKSKFLVPAETSKHPDGKAFVPCVMAHVDRILERLKTGGASPIFLAHLKSEPAGLKSLKPTDDWTPCSADCGFDCHKYRLKDPRMFCGTPAAWSHVVRKYFLSVLALAQRYNFAFECGVGLNAEGGDWAALREYLVYYGEDRIIAGDYAKYDKSLDGLILTYACWVLIEICSKSDHFTEEDIEIMWNITTDTAFPCVLFVHILIRLFGSLPSGHPLTVLLNSICNSLLMRLAWIELGGDPRHFRKHVRLMTYGDDNIMGVSPDAEFFNHCAISKALGKMGMVYTMADKEAKSVPFIHIDDADFLKRSFVKRDDRIFAPLDERSIFRSLAYKSDTKLDIYAHGPEVASSAIRSAFQHGRSYYDNFCSWFRVVLVSHQLLGVEIPSYDEWVQITEPAYSTSSLIPLS